MRRKPSRLPWWPLLTIALPLSACSGPAASDPAGCGLVPLIEYSQDQQDRVAEEMTEAAGAAAWPSFVVDYALLRNEVRACQRASR